MTTKSGRGTRRRTQDDPNTSEDLTNLEESIHRCIRYLLYVSQANVPIKKADIVKNPLNGSGKSYELIIGEVGKYLDKIYGIKLINFDEGNTKLYLLLKGVPRIDTESDHNPSDSNKILTMLILTHVFMSNNAVNEGSMDAFLSSFDIDTDRKHHFFGNVKEFMNTTLVKQKFLKVVIDDVTRKSTYTWGSRAEATVSKKDILEFVCKMYSLKKDLQPSSWETQYKEAQQQDLVFNQHIPEATE